MLEENLVKETTYLNFSEVTGGTNKGRNYTVRNKNCEILGWINLYPKWRKYVYTTNSDSEYTILDTECLQAIYSFMLTIEK